MAVVPHTIDIVARDLAKSLAFYSALGLDTPAFDPEEFQVQIVTSGGATLGLIAESAMHEHNPDWVTPIGQRVTFACRCDTPEELDSVYARVIGAGFIGAKEPWDAFWGQRYAFLSDPDGNRVDLFAALSDAGVE
jgi:catechol 2,3-dioxygenase-like lactoylglutathione lyase family enzyme